MNEFLAAAMMLMGIVSFILFAVSLFAIAIAIYRKEDWRPGVSGLIFSLGLFAVYSFIAYYLVGVLASMYI